MAQQSPSYMTQKNYFKLKLPIIDFIIQIDLVYSLVYNFDVPAQHKDFLISIIMTWEIHTLAYNRYNFLIWDFEDPRTIQFNIIYLVGGIVTFPARFRALCYLTIWYCICYLSLLK